jgi:hypothetical protein
MIRRTGATAMHIHFRPARNGLRRAVWIVTPYADQQMKVARQGRRNMTKRDRKKRMETGPDSAGQGGATQQISDTPIADSESVEELAEEGNAFEADAIYGVENASDPDVSEVITHEIPEDDVPGEYLDSDDHLA